MAKDLVVKTLTSEQAMNRLREVGIPISQRKFKALAETGAFPFVRIVQLEETEYFILGKDLERWIRENGEEIEQI